MSHLNFNNDVIANYEPLQNHHFRGRLYSESPNNSHQRNSFHQKQVSPDMLITPNHTYQQIQNLSNEPFGVKPQFGISAKSQHTNHRGDGSGSGTGGGGGGGSRKVSASSSKLDVKETEAERKRKRSLHLVNNLARILFPLSFLLFNICYWLTLLIKVRKNEHYTDGQGFIAL